MKTVAVVVFDRIPVFELAVPCEVFGIDRSAMGVPNYRLLLCNAEHGMLRTSAGFLIQVDKDLSALGEADTIIVPAWRNIDEAPPVPLITALQQAYQRGVRITSLCSGAFILAAAGLLDGRRATTHWMHAGALADRFPAVQVDAGVLYIDEGQILTSAGTAAGIDVCLHLVRLDYGAEVANVFARRMVVAPHRDGGQAQYVQAPVPDLTANSSYSETAAWACRHLHEPLTVQHMASHARVPLRTFARHFRGATGATPGQWLIRQRVLAARRRLETTDSPIEHIAQECGFGSAATLRLHFRRSLGIAPTAYRHRFRHRNP